MTWGILQSAALSFWKRAVKKCHVRVVTIVVANGHSDQTYVLYKTCVVLSGRRGHCFVSQRKAIIMWLSWTKRPELRAVLRAGVFALFWTHRAQLNWPCEGEWALQLFCSPKSHALFSLFFPSPQWSNPRPQRCRRLLWFDEDVSAWSRLPEWNGLPLVSPKKTYGIWNL